MFPSQRIIGEAAEKNLYLSQLIILDTLEKCLAGVSRQSCFTLDYSHPFTYKVIVFCIPRVKLTVQQITL